MRETRISAARAAALFYDGAAAAVPKMMRPAEGKIPYPYLSPGAQYHGQLWDWDSYWATVAVLRLFDDPETGHRYDRAFRMRFLEHVAGSLQTFFSYQGPDGSLPINLTPRRGDVFGCTARRVRGAAETNMGKPVFAQMMLEYLRASGAVDFVRQLFAPLKRFHRCWEKRYRHPGTGLFVWGSDVAIGVDDDPTTWGRPPFSSANILLNNLMYADLSAAATLARRLDLKADAVAYDNAAPPRLACAIRTYAWDERDSFFYMVDVQCRRRLALGWVHRNWSLSGECRRSRCSYGRGSCRCGTASPLVNRLGAWFGNT